MKKAISFLIPFSFFSMASASFFMASNILMPLKSVVSHQQTHIPRMSIRFAEFSPAFAAMEDDYYIANFEEETIPDGPAKTLEPGEVILPKSSTQELQLPRLSLNPRQEPVSDNVYRAEPWTAPMSAVERLSEEIKKQQVEPVMEAGVQVPHHWIQGKIELTGGLAITDPRDRIAIGWFSDGERSREGKIDLNAGTYEIKVDTMEGELIAELVDRKGFLMGEAVIDLNDVTREKGTGLIIANVDIKIRPYEFPLANVQSVYAGGGTHMPITNAHVSIGDHDIRYVTKEDGKVRDPALNKKSTGMLVAQATGHRSSVVLGDFETEQVIRMFPEKFMGALFEIIDTDDKLRNNGIIWGTIKRNQIPVSGYKARIAGYPGVPVIYFNVFIPTDTQERTSADGQFAFVGLPDGEYEVEVLDATDTRVDTKVASVRHGSVSVSDFEVGDKTMLSLRPFDPFVQAPKGVELMMVGEEEVHLAQTEDVLKLPVFKGNDPVLLYAKVENAKLGTNTFASRKRKSQDVPVLNHDWWNKIQNDKKINIASGVIVGFVDSDEPFEVYVEEPGSSKILYFNTLGGLINPGQGQKPSGFIIYGVGQGLKTLVIDSQSGLLTTEAAYVDGESVSLIYKSY